jgi:hypothetical protein
MEETAVPDLAALYYTPKGVIYLGFAAPKIERLHRGAKPR